MFHLERLRDPACSQEYALTVSNRFDVFGTLEKLEDLWDTFKHENLQTAKECIGVLPRSTSCFTLVETLGNIERRRAARFGGNWNQYRALSQV